MAARICQTEIFKGSNTVLTVFKTVISKIWYILDAAISDFDEHSEILMIESGTFEGHSAGRIVGKDGSDDQTPWEPSKHSTLKPLTRF